MFSDLKIQAVYNLEAALIRAAGREPAICERCKQRTLWPAPLGIRNAVSRFEPKMYICGPCALDESGLLEQRAAELAIAESDKNG